MGTTRVTNATDTGQSWPVGDQTSPADSVPQGAVQCHTTNDLDPTPQQTSQWAQRPPAPDLQLHGVPQQGPVVPHGRHLQPSTNNGRPELPVNMKSESFIKERR